MFKVGLFFHVNLIKTVGTRLTTLLPAVSFRTRKVDGLWPLQGVDPRRHGHAHLLRYHRVHVSGDAEHLLLSLLCSSAAPSVGSLVGGGLLASLQGSRDPDEERTQPSGGLVESGRPDVRHAHWSG